MSERSEGIFTGSAAAAVLFAVLVSLGLSLTSVNDVTWEQRGLVFGMFAMSSLSYAGWRRHSGAGLPVFAIIASIYSLYFALALFWGNRTSPSFLDAGRPLPDEAITGALRMTALGVTSVWLGMRLGLARHFIDASRLPDIPAAKLRSAWIRGLVVFGALGGFANTIPGSLTDLRNAVIILFVFVPLVPFALLLDAFWAGKASATDKILIGLFVVCRAAAGMGTGTLTTVVSLGFVIGASFVRARKTIPWLAVTMTICVMLFLQPAKSQYRHRFQYEDDQMNLLDRGEYWVGASWELWSGFFSHGDSSVFASLASTTLERASLLTQAALVYEKTPSLVPFQNGATYRYMAVTLIPRLFWPDKPSANDANRFYQVAYGLSREKELTTSMAAGVLPESYMNFGWPGVIAVMFVMGIVYETYQQIFFSAHSGRLANAIGLALITQVLIIESQMAVYLGGIIQQLLFTGVMLMPVLQFSGSGRRSRTSAPNNDALYLSSFQRR